MNEKKYNQRLSTLELVCISNAIWTALSYFIMSEHIDLVYNIIKHINP